MFESFSIIVGRGKQTPQKEGLFSSQVEAKAAMGGLSPYYGVLTSQNRKFRHFSFPGNNFAFIGNNLGKREKHDLAKHSFWGEYFSQDFAQTALAFRS